MFKTVLFQSYVCQIAAWKQPEIVHSINVRTKPVIQMTSGDEIRVKEVDSLNLGCEVISGRLQMTISCSFYSKFCIYVHQIVNIYTNIWLKDILNIEDNRKLKVEHPLPFTTDIGKM